jgi:mannosylglycoprotein endo-beta-mannosidase
LIEWARNLSGQYKIEKDRLLNIVEILDCKAETVPLDAQERHTMRKANDDLAKLRRDEESKWAQRAKVKHVQQGGDNTKYFHLIANGKHRRKRIFQLEQEEGTILGQENLKHYISKYYKNLFGPPPPSSCVMVESMNHDIKKISAEENAILIADFTMEEVKKAVMQMKKNRAPGPDGFPAEFYQNFWDILKSDLMAMFECLNQS